MKDKERTVRIELPRRQPTPDLWRGALAGLMGGIAGAAAKLLVEGMLRPRSEGQKAPLVLLAEKVSGKELEPAEAEVARHGIHWAFGPLVGAAYGAAVEFEPDLTARHGAAFGLGLNTVTHKRLLPLLGDGDAQPQEPVPQRLTDIAGHVAFGVVTETVRKMIRGR